jgi:cytochrome c oxidase cbb3-type subunit 4
MSDTYNAVSSFAQSWGLLYFVAVFTFVVVFVMWPSRRDRYEDAGNIPFREDRTDG